MRFVRFALPFLFARNWYTGQWEISRARLILFLLTLLFLVIGFSIVYILQKPIVYTSQIV